MKNKWPRDIIASAIYRLPDINIRFFKLLKTLTHWGRVTHICVSKLTIIGSVNGFSTGRRQAITWTNAGLLSIAPLGINLSVNLVEIHICLSKQMHLKMSPVKWRPFHLGLNVLTSYYISCRKENMICYFEGDYNNNVLNYKLHSRVSPCDSTLLDE